MATRDPVNHPNKKRSKTILVACNGCRARKTACDGTRPRCSKCAKRNSHCRYDTEDAEETRVSALKRENEALRRRVFDLESARESPPARDVSSPCPLGPIAQLPSHRVARAALPPTRSWLEYDLLTSYASSYRVLEPLDYRTVQASFGTLADLLNSHDFRPGSRGASHLQQRGEIADGSPPAGGDHTQDPVSMQLLRSYLPSPSYCDQRLDDLVIKYWTQVEISNELAARLVSWYLEIDHPTFGFFDSDLFVRDLVRWQHTHCSRMLANTVLYWACHSYSAVNKTVAVLRSRFLAEAMSEWDGGQMATANVPTAAAALLMSVGLAATGQDPECHMLFASCRMAEGMDLYGPPSEVPHGLATEQLECLRARSQFAWGLFNWVTYRCFFYHDTVMRFAPKFPVPGADGVLAYDTADKACYHSLPSYMGETFTLACKFWLIVNEIALTYYSDPKTPVQSRVSLNFAEVMYRRLLDWAETTLGRPPERSEGSHHLNIFYIMFHGIILFLFRPFQTTNDKLATFQGSPSTVRGIFDASVQQLRFYVLTHPVDHPIASSSVLWHNALLFIINASLENLGDTESWFFFLLCLRRYQEMSDHFAVMKSMVRGFLSMAIERSAISAADSRQLLNHMQQGIDEEPNDGPQLRGAFVLDLRLALVDGRRAHAEALADCFDRSIDLDSDGSTSTGLT